MDSKLASIERIEFCNRLASALTRAGYSLSVAAFVKEFNLRADGAAVTVHGARKWIVGEAFPTHERLHVMSKWLHVSPQWLRYGEGPFDQVSESGNSTGIAHNEVLMLSDFRRLDERSQAVVRDVIHSLLLNQSPRK